MVEVVSGGSGVLVDEARGMSSRYRRRRWLRRWWPELVFIPAAVMFLGALLVSPTDLGLVADAPAVTYAQTVQKLPLCLSHWREIKAGAPGRFVLVFTARVNPPAKAMRIEDADGKLVAIVHAGEERNWTCDLPVMPVPWFKGKDA